MTDKKLTIEGREVPRDLVGELHECAPDADLAHELAVHGYLLLRGVHPVSAVQAAREEVLGRLEGVGEVGHPAHDGRMTGVSRRAQMHPNLGAFWKSVSEGPRLRSAVHGPAITTTMQRLFGVPVAPFSFVWLRAMAPGRASPLHVDHPYMNRGTDRLVTVWTPLGDVTRDGGALYLLEGSHRWEELRRAFQGHDVDRDPSRPGHIKEHAVDLARRQGARLLTADFRMGDCLVFGMFAAHASFDNASAGGRVRVSCDVRFQPESEAMDERFAGIDPPAHGGKGYGCLSAAQPLTAAPVLR